MFNIIYLLALPVLLYCTQSSYTPKAKAEVHKYSKLMMQYVLMFHEEGLNIILLHTTRLFHNCANLLEL